MRNFLLDLLFPPVPLGREPMSRAMGGDPEELRAHPLRFEGYVLSRRGLPSIDRLVCAASYASSPLVQEAIRRFKYRRMSRYGEELGRMLIDTSAFLPSWPPPVVCPVPLHWTRRFLRGFNQARVLADAVAAAREWPVVEYLVRVRPTGSQARRSTAARRSALEGAFAWQGGGPVPSRVILIDDVVTSGATLEACARMLKEAGVERVDAMTIAVSFA